MKPSQVSGQPEPAKRDHRQEVTDSIIKMLEEGVAPWQKPWDSTGMPLNPNTEREYRGGNAVHLMAVGMARGYEDPRWMTYKQAAEKGWQVRQGEKGTHIEFWDVKSKADKDTGGSAAKPELEESSAGRRLIHRVYTVFNAKQIDGVPAFERRDHSPFESIQNGERILARSGAKIDHAQRDTAFYNRKTDSIHLPLKDAFKNEQGYYGTALHELAHWTGHPSRLNRPTLTDSYRFGDLNYAKEELRAELASVFIAAEVGIPHNPANHAAYVGSWIKVLKDDKNEIFRAAHDASAASDFVLNLEREISKAEALEASDGAQPDRIRDEIETLENDRDTAPSNNIAARSVDNREVEPKESYRFVSRLESRTGTVSLHDKQIGSDRLSPVDLTDSSGASSRTDAVAPKHALPEDLNSSFTAARNLTAAALGNTARAFTAQTQSGQYRGPIIGETDLHVVQKLSPQTTVAHLKQLLEPTPHVGDNSSISYANDRASVKEWRERSRGKELAR